MKQLFEGSITKVHGIRVGQAQNDAAKTGVTVVLCSHDGAVMGADVRGAAPGTRETDLCKPENTVERVNAVVLSGGSAYGLDSASGVMRFLEEHGAGVDMGVCKVPIVPAAVLFDLKVGDAHVRPDAAMGYEACEKASKEVRQGAYGAGTGATVGKLIPGTVPAPSGIGTASITLGLRPSGRRQAGAVRPSALRQCAHPGNAEDRYPLRPEYHHRRGRHGCGADQGTGPAHGHLRS